MKTPVIIAARDEGDMLGRTLSQLNARIVEPYVIANGCNDNTADVARSFGAKVFEKRDPGKLPAIQHILRVLGEQALEPILYTDADSYPLSVVGWHRQMTQALDKHKPSVSSGPIVFDSVTPRGISYGIWYYMKSCRAYGEGLTNFQGANMATHFQKGTVLKRVLELPHIWLGDDHAIGQAVTAEGGTGKQVIHPKAAVVTSSRYLFPVSDYFTQGRDGVRQKIHVQYSERAAEGSISFSQYEDRDNLLAKEASAHS